MENRKLSGVVYTLSDSNGNVFYVGKTSLPIHIRLQAHISETRCALAKCKKRSHYNLTLKCQKIVELDFNIQCEVIDVVRIECKTLYEARKKFCKIERKHMKALPDKGCKLTNKEANRVIKLTEDWEKVGYKISSIREPNRIDINKAEILETA
jgi:hypothetical protein